MINRRHIRAKVMQSVYAMQQSRNDDLSKQIKLLKYHISKMLDLYVLNFQLIVEVQKLAEKKILISKKNQLPTKEDLNPNTKFLENRLICTIINSSSFKNYIQINKLDHWKLDNEYVKIIWNQLQKSSIYKDYISTKENSYSIDKNFIIKFFKEIIAPSQKLAEYYEDKLMSWVNDIPFVNTLVLKTLIKQKEHTDFVIGNLYKDQEDEKFALVLFNKVVLNQHTYEEDIKEKILNWENDRIASIDMILIKMAITEFLYFRSIPAKVSINEYIELAKEYSTEKSGYFINGVLDKLSKDYLKSKKMIKLGRGLV